MSWLPFTSTLPAYCNFACFDLVSRWGYSLFFCLTKIFIHFFFSVTTVFALPFVFFSSIHTCVRIDHFSFILPFVALMQVKLWNKLIWYTYMSVEDLYSIYYLHCTSLPKYGCASWFYGIGNIDSQCPCPTTYYHTNIGAQCFYMSAGNASRTLTKVQGLTDHWKSFCSQGTTVPWNQGQWCSQEWVMELMPPFH